MYAVFKNGKQCSKAHPSIEVAKVEAFEMGAIIDWGADWETDKPGRGLADGYEIKEITLPGGERSE